jgi:CubicO group peptidase (beta-lactamase class C family)
MRTASSVFPPHQQASYSNAGYSLLGLVVQSVTHMQYEEYVHKAILQPLGLGSTTFTTPPEERSAIPNGPSQWTQDLGSGDP